MTKARKRKQPNHQQRNRTTNQSPRRAEPGGHRHSDRLNRIRSWLRNANKTVLTTIGASILTIIGSAVVGLPHLLATRILSSPPSLTVTGTSSPDITDLGIDPCSFGEDFIVSGTSHPWGSMSGRQITSLLKNSADSGSTAGMYTLQADSDQTITILDIRTIVLRRVPAPRATEIDFPSECPVSSPPMPISYLPCHVSVDLDGMDLTPKVQVDDPVNLGRMTAVYGLQTVVTKDNPIIVDFEAETSKYDVTWKFRVDYTVNGKLRTAWIQNGSHPFHTEAGRRDDNELLFTPRNGNSWTFRKGEPFQVSCTNSECEDVEWPSRSKQLKSAAG